MSAFGAASVDGTPDLARLGPVIHIKDVDSDQLQNVYRGHGNVGGAGSEGNLTPGKISVAAGVLLGFSLLAD